MSVSSLKEEIEILKNLLKNLRKSPNRQRSRESANRKIKEIEHIYGRINKVNRELKEKYPTRIEEKDIFELRDAAKGYKEKALEIVIKNIKDENTNSDDNSSDEDNRYIEAAEISEQQEKEFKNNTKMAEFDYNTAQKLPILSIEREDKRTECIRDFINNVEFYHNTLNNQGKITLISFIIKCKIQGKALTELGNLVPITLDELKRDLKQMRIKRYNRNNPDEIKYDQTRAKTHERIHKGD